MTNTYDAWSEFTPEVAAAIRYAVKTGDWSDIAAYDPEVATALEQAVGTGDYQVFDPHVAVALRSAIGQDTINQQIAEDRALAAELRQLSEKYPDFAQHQTEILKYAVDGGLGDAETAFKAWYSATGRLDQGPAARDGAPAAGDQPSLHAKRLAEIKAELDNLDGNYDSATELKRTRLKWERDDLQNEQAAAHIKAANDPDQERRDLIHDANEASRRHNAERMTRVSRGYPDKSDRMSKDEKRARQLIEAGDIASGRVQLPKPQRKSSAQRAAEAAGLDARDIEALDLVHSQDGPEVSTPNAEAVLQDIESN